MENVEEKEKKLTNFDSEEWHVGPKGFVALIAAILFFSGAMAGGADMKWMSAFDFNTLAGKFGTVKALGKDTFVGAGGLGARAGFLFALSLVPSVMLALGCLEVLSHYGAIKAAHKLLTPLLHPLLGIPGLAGLALVTDLQSTDAGAVLTKELYDQELITKKELTIIGAWQYSGAGLINNYFAICSALFSYLTVPILVPFALMFIFKFVGAMFVRAVLNSFYKEDFKYE